MFCAHNVTQRYVSYTVNVDIFACIDFRGFMKLGNFACIKICVLCIIGSIGYYKSNFRGVHIFADIQETRTTQKYVQRENIYVLSISIGRIVIFCYAKIQ